MEIKLRNHKREVVVQVQIEIYNFYKAIVRNVVSSTILIKN